MEIDDVRPRACAACAGRAARVARPMARGPASPATPLPPSGFAAGSSADAGHGEGGAGSPARRAGPWRATMSTSADAELELFRQSVNCAAVLERMVGGWKLDVRESTRRALKYRRGEGEIIIVNHDGRGWWDPTGSAKGDVFNLVQHLDPSLNFGAVRKVLRGFVGMAPTYPAASRRQKSDSDKTERPPAERWAERPPLRRGDPAWTYLAEERAIPAEVLNAAAKQDCVRRSAYGSAWFAHRRDGVVTQVEIRNRTYKGSLRGGLKTLFQFGDADDQARRIVVLEAPIDALSLAAIERVRSDTLYVSTGGGMGPGTLDALQTALAHLRAGDGVLVSAADANTAGDRYAARHAELAAAADVAFERLRPPDGQDWNDVLVARRRA